MSEKDTPTPRTDQAEMTIDEVRCFLPDTAKVVSPDFARQLERELTEARKQRDTLAGTLEMVRDADEDCHKDGLQTIPVVARCRIDQALATVKGGEP